MTDQAKQNLKTTGARPSSGSQQPDLALDKNTLKDLTPGSDAGEQLRGGQRIMSYDECNTLRTTGG